MPPRNKKGASSPQGAKGARGGSARGGRVYRGGRGASRGRGRGRDMSALATIDLIRGNTGGFTLADEARNTSTHDHSYLTSSSNLRQRPVTFISAGVSEPLDKPEEIDDLTDAAEPLETEPTALENHIDDHDVHEDVSEENNVIELLLNDPILYQDENNDGNINVDSDEDEHRLDDGTMDVIGPDELEEAIQAQEQVRAEIQEVPEVREVPEVSEEPTFFFDLKGAQSDSKKKHEHVTIPERPSSRSSTSSDEVILFKGRNQKRPTPSLPTPKTEISMAQMHTEIRMVEETIIQETSRELPVEPVATDSSAPAASHKVAKKQAKRKKIKKSRGSARSRFQDEEEAMLADYIQNMRDNGDADDLLDDIDGLDAEVESSPIRSKAPMHHDLMDQVSDCSSSSSDDNGDEEEMTEEPEQDGTTSEIDDETLARLIAGNDLGMEDVNFGDSLSESSSSEDEKKTKKKLTIDEDDFDFMDWDRPSLRRRKGKGARAQVNFNVSDSELEQALQSAWSNDRLKKSQRKKQREELRALGMLGKNANPDDLRVKYPDGMNLDQVGEEMRVFLMQSLDTLAFPPMDNHARKVIHDLANKFKIKSKSTGKADQRRPVLYRTLRTLTYSATTFDQAINKISRRYLPRLDTKGKGKKTKQVPSMRGANVAAATYRDGEIVGASAPELGVENRGRAMLEKMGWSTGTALGAVNNKGILQPVAQAMKRTKAGLG